MTIGTTRFFGNNSELFTKLNTELQSLQTQAGTGKAELKLANNIGDISKLSAAEEKKSETNQLLSNSQRAQTDLDVMDVGFERLQNLLVRLQELAVERSNDTLTPEARQRFVIEASMIKTELVDVATQKDNFDNSLIDEFVKNTKFIKRVVELDKSQPEFKLTLNQYLDKVVNKTRIKKAKIKLKENKTLLSKISQYYQVQPRFIIALWGIETDFGRIGGYFPVISSLATLVYDGRRA